MSVLYTPGYYVTSIVNLYCFSISLI